MTFATKPHYQIRQRAPRHFFQTADQVGIGRQVIESVIQELLNGDASSVESMVVSLPANVLDEITSSVEAGIKGRLRLLGIASCFVNQVRSEVATREPACQENSGVAHSARTS